MIEQTLHVAGADRYILTAETPEEAHELSTYFSNRQPYAVDVETNAYNIFDPRFAIRLVQFSDRERAAIFPVEIGIGLAEVEFLLQWVAGLVAHNAKYDLLALEKVGLLDSVDSVSDKFIDTLILCHMLDPVGKDEGGTGLALVDNCARYVDEDTKDTDTELKKHFKSLGFKTKEEGYRNVDLFDLIYLQYSGMDPVNTMLLLEVIAPLVIGQQS